MRVPFFRVPFVAAAALAVTLAAVPSAAPAQYVTFRGSGTVIEPFAGLTEGAFTFAFTVPARPRPDRVTDGFFGLLNKVATFRQGPMRARLIGQFSAYSELNGGGFAFTNDELGTLMWVSSPEQVYEGSTSSPWIRGGSPFIRGNYEARTGVRYFEYTPSVVPEPGTWALLGTGLLALGGVAHRRRRQSV